METTNNIKLSQIKVKYYTCQNPISNGLLDSRIVDNIQD